MKNTLFILIILIILFNSTHESGTVVHLEVCHRASKHLEPKFTNILLAYQDYFQTGIIFPDWGYILGFAFEAELAHEEVTISKILDKIKILQLESELRYQMLAFVAGMICHSVTDTLWHGTNNDTMAFIGVQSMIDYDLNCKPKTPCYTLSHDYADDGGDIVILKEISIDYILLDWSYPFNPSEFIYNGTIDNWSINWRMFIYKLQLVANKLKLSNIMRFKYSNYFINRHLTDWVRGGIDHMAGITLQYWNSVFDLKEIDDQGISDDVIKEKLEESDESGYQIISEPNYKLSKGRVKILFKKSNQIITSNESIARFGHSTVIWDDKLVITAPLYGDFRIEKMVANNLTFNYNKFMGSNSGAAFIYKINKKDHKLIKTIIPSKNMTWFGWGAITCQNRLVVSSPFSQENNGLMVGRITVIDSKYNEINIIGERKLSWFGYSIACNDEILIVGAPLFNEGIVYGYNISNSELMFMIKGSDKLTGRYVKLNGSELVIHSENKDYQLRTDYLSGEILI